MDIEYLQDLKFKLECNKKLNDLYINDDKQVLIDLIDYTIELKNDNNDAEYVNDDLDLFSDIYNYVDDLQEFTNKLRNNLTHLNKNDIITTLEEITDGFIGAIDNGSGDLQDFINDLNKKV